MLNLGTVPAGTTLPIPFATYGGTDGESITCTGLAVTDIEIYKDGSVTQRASDNGYTLLDTDGIDFDGLTGIHGFSIDLSDNTDAGFFEVGSWYWVVVSAITVDSQTVNFIAAMFRIGPAEAVTGYQPVDTAAVSGDTTAADNLELACDNYSATRGLTGTAVPAAAADAAGGIPVSDAGGLDMDAKLAEANEITAARMGALTDWIDGGRLDLLLDAIKAVTDAESGVKAAVDALNDFDPAADAVANVTLVDTTTTNTDMRGTDNAALASVLGALDDAAAAGEVTDADTLVQYIKQIINVLIGTPGIGTFPAEAAPGDGVSLAEVIRAIHVDVTGLNGDAMRGTDSAATAAKLLAYIQLLARSDAAIETDNAAELTEINADGGSGAGDFSAQTDGGEAIRDHIGDGTSLTEAGGDGDHLTEAGGDGDHLTEAGGDGDHLAAIPWNPAWDAEVESEVLDALITAGACGDGDTLAAGSVGETLRWLRHFAKNEWRIDETPDPDTFKIYKDDGSTESYGFTVYTSSSINYRDPV